MATSLTATDVSKRYGAVQALSSADLEIRGGEVTALLGANGSGKSTLGKIITGLTRPDSGRLELDSRPLSLTTPHQARRLGITAVYQELSLVPDLSVAENIWLGHEPRRLGGIDHKRMRDEADELLSLFTGTFGAAVTPNTAIRSLPPSERQVIEILKALSQRPRVLILDEATASLDAKQVERLFELVGEGREEGMAIAFISHRMEEIFRIADRAVVLRNGETVGERAVAETDEAELVALMTGGVKLARRDAGVQGTTGEIAMEVAGLVARRVKAFELTVRKGELVGLGGLQGQGQEEVLLSLFGAVPHQGKISLNGRSVHLGSPRAAMRLGVAYVPGDRGSEGLLPIRPIVENLQLTNWRAYGVPIRFRRAVEDARRAAGELNIKYAVLDDPVSSLSGGNAQKVVIGKWLLRDPSILLLNDPTKGIDVEAKAEFYALLEKLKAAGSAIVLHSSDDAELLSLCDRVVVMRDGLITAKLEGEQLSHERLVAASLGGVPASASAHAGAQGSPGRGKQ